MLTEIQAEIAPSVEASLNAALATSRLMLLGEVHGVEENAAIVYTMFRRFRFSALALEWPAGTDLRTPTLSEDGRITPFHFELMRCLEDEGLLKQLILFDHAGDGTWSGRDLAMASSLLAQLRPDLTTLVVAGNLHTETRRLSYGHPMGEHIAANVPGVAIGRIRYLGGNFHNFGLKPIRRPFWQRRKRARLHERNRRFIFDLPHAHAASAPA